MAAIDVRPVFYVIGSLLIIVALAMLVPMAVDLAVGNPDWSVFGTASALTLFFGVLLMLTNWTPAKTLNLRQTFLLTTFAWIVVCTFGALPFLFAETRLSFTDAYFEAMSGLTTTGGTVIVGLDRLAPGLLLWRSLLQWLGGLGIIAMAIAILPFLRVGGMQLFRAESSDRSDKVVPRASDLAVSLGWIYLGLTAACAVLLTFSGMSVFDAVNHAMTAMSTGGFSTRDSSVSCWDDGAVHWTLTAFMIMGALPFVRLISFARGDTRSLWRDSQIRWFLAFLAAVSLGMGVVSVVTTTGYTSTDYGLWGPFAVAVFLILTVIGGCTGSTTGGIKIFRFEILFMVMRVQLIRLYSPHRMMPLTYGGKPVDNDIMVSVMAFGFAFAASILIVIVALSAIGLDFLTAVSGAVTAVANVGPGLGPVIGPVGNFSSLPDAAKWVLSVAMLLGRLEFFTVLVLLNPKFWMR
jgi:trk system potassium uptake protein TrkH